MSLHTLSAASAWAIAAHAVKPAVAGTPASFRLGSNGNNFVLGGTTLNLFPHTNPNPGVGVQVGDLLLLGIVMPAGAAAITAPSVGWTVAAVGTGVGTRNVSIATFWKTAGAGDIPSPQNWTLSASIDAVGWIGAYKGFNLSTPIDGTGSADSGADGTAATGPSSPFPGDLVVEITGARSATGGVSESSTTISAHGGQGSGSPSGLFITGGEYVSVVADQWHVGSAASGANWA